VDTPVLRRAIAAYESGAWAEAEAACNELLRTDPRQADALQILGNIRARSGDTRGAEPLLERARAADPGNMYVLNSLGGVYAANGRLNEAREALLAALRIDPDFPWALQNLGGILMEAGDRAGARHCFERALATDPRHVESLSALADLAEKEGRPDDARSLAGRALALVPGFPGARIVLAELDRRAGNHAAVESAMRELLTMPLRPATEATSHNLLARALEGLGRFDEAFAEFTRSNDIDRAAHAARLADAEFAASPGTLARLQEFIRATDPDQWTKAASDGLPDPVFLVGFPRSGTTLLQQMLAGHPSVVTLEEQENLRDAHGPLLLAPGAFDRWTAMTADELSGFRRAYWGRVEARMPRPAPGRVYLDKLPLNLALLPLLHLLFPGAKVILLLRDPRDAILSCFRNRFTMNAAMYRFLSLDTATHYYDAVMGSAEAARERLPLALHALHYEALVADPRSEAERILGFLGLPWDDGVLCHAETASRRVVMTPSATQVIQPVYRTATGQWRRHAAGLAPVLPALERWAEKLGY
jgi:tetratricopeptide (TPR) repeat protein